ncbi:tenascin-like [Saccostrea cucullata]|uniref:tenascin-like n=1 Tax=Saccostrea cuccullata TaxID=36930 RepID=UPI002ED521D6
MAAIWDSMEKNAFSTDLTRNLAYVKVDVNQAGKDSNVKEGFMRDCGMFVENDLLLYGFMACDSNMFGKDCSKLCGSCRDETQCHHITGTCHLGCNSGYIGDAYNEGICDHVTGVCKDGCKSGWMGLDCLEDIVPQSLPFDFLSNSTSSVILTSIQIGFLTMLTNFRFMNCNIAFNMAAEK